MKTLTAAEIMVLMKKAETGEEVAGVLGHELNHVLQRHGLERIVKSLGLMAVVSIVLGDQQGLIGLMKQVGVELLTLKFDRAQETEADVTGLRLVARARIDPKGMITFFQKLSEYCSSKRDSLKTSEQLKGLAQLGCYGVAVPPESCRLTVTFWAEA